MVEDFLRFLFISKEVQFDIFNEKGLIENNFKSIDIKIIIFNLSIQRVITIFLKKFFSKFYVYFKFVRKVLFFKIFKKIYLDVKKGQNKSLNYLSCRIVFVVVLLKKFRQCFELILKVEKFGLKKVFRRVFELFQRFLEYIGKLRDYGKIVGVVDILKKIKLIFQIFVKNNKKLLKN